MIDWAQGGWTGSIKRWVAREVQRHLRHNATLHAAKYPISLRLLRYLIADHPFAWFLALYVSVDLSLGLFAVAGHLVWPGTWTAWISSSDQTARLLEDATGYFIAAQVGALSIVSIAVGLVTLIAQRQNSSIDVQIYYHESLAQEVVASSIALLTVLCVEVFWPAQLLMTYFIGSSLPPSNLESILTTIHTVWLVVNLWALAHFVSLSLRFVHPADRESIRESYTANWVVRNDLTHHLRRALYLGAAENLIEHADETSRPLIVFGYDLNRTEQPEIETRFRRPSVLSDVRVRPLRWALQRWWHRCQQQEPSTSVVRRGVRQNGPRILFTPYFDRVFEGRIAWCYRAGGVPFTALERWIIRHSFRFQRAPQ